MDFGKLVKDAREGLGWSQQKLAQRMKWAGFSWFQSTTAKTERAARPVPIQEAVTLAALLHIDISKLVPAKLYACPVCCGEPPQGFTCNECKLAG